MELNYDELYQIRYLLKYNIENDKTLHIEEIKVLTSALKKVQFQLKVLVFEKEILEKDVCEIKDIIKI
jgi:hypothetical protein